MTEVSRSTTMNIKTRLLLTDGDDLQFLYSWEEEGVLGTGTIKFVDGWPIEFNWRATE